MKKNLIDHRIENIHILNNTLAHVAGEIDIAKFRKVCNPDDLLEISKDAIININNIYHAITIDELFLLNCELLILELEGFHKLAICGALKTIQKFKPTIIFVKNNLDEIEKNMGIHVSLDTLLKKLKYKMHTIDDTYSIAMQCQQEQDVVQLGPPQLLHPPALELLA